MKNNRTLGLAIATMLLIGTASAQNTTQITEGTLFEVAFPALWGMQTEVPLPVPLHVMVHSRVATTVEVEFDSMGVHLVKVYKVAAGVGLDIPLKALPDILNGGHKLPDGPTAGIAKKAISIRSQAPITVSTRMDWQGNGNGMMHLPVAAWGTSYRAFSYPQDEYGGRNGPLHTRPGQIVVIAAHDNTKVSFSSPCIIAKGVGLPDTMPANQLYTVTLNKHQTMTLLAQVILGQSHTKATDLTGTHITSSKPIAVLSGHTKGAVGDAHPLLPPFGMYSAPAHFIRTNFAQCVLPDYLADTMFLTAPLMYEEGVRKASNGDLDTVHRLGDVVRVLAMEDATLVYQLSESGADWQKVATLNAGDYYTELGIRRACAWKTSKPAHVMQYGKSYGRAVIGPTHNSKDPDIEVPQGHPTTQCGMPTMLIVPGTSRWIQERGSFISPEGMDNFASFIIPTEYVQRMKLDGRSVTYFGASTSNVIAGTPYTAVVTPISAGSHKVTVDSGDFTFMSWAFGSIDGLQQNRSYGFPLAMNFRQPCADSIVVMSETNIGKGTVTANLVTSESCSRFISYELVSTSNARIDSTHQSDAEIVVFVSHVQSDTLASMTLRFTSTSGRSIEHTVYIDSIAKPVYRIDVELRTTEATKNYISENAFRSLGVIPDHIVACMITARYNEGTMQSRTARVAGHDVVTATDKTSTYKFIISDRTANATVAVLEYLVLADSSALWPIEVLNFVWLDADSVVQNVDTRFTRVVPPPPVSVNESGENVTSKPLTVFPQPAHDVINITYRMGLQGGSMLRSMAPSWLRVFDVTGALVMDLSDKLIGEEGTIVVDANVLTPGFYLLQLMSGVDASVVRMVVD